MKFINYWMKTLLSPRTYLYKWMTILLIVRGKKENSAKNAGSFSDDYLSTIGNTYMERVITMIFISSNFDNDHLLFISQNLSFNVKI